MLNDRHGSYGPFGYTIAAADVAASAVAAAQYRDVRKPRTVRRGSWQIGSFFTGLRDVAAAIARPQHARTA